MKPTYEEMEAERDALAAKVKAWNECLYIVDGWADSDSKANYGDAKEWLRHLRNWINRNAIDDYPTDYLSRLKSEWQGEALELEAENGDYGSFSRERLRKGAKFYREQAEKS